MNGEPVNPRDVTWAFIWFGLLSAIAFDVVMYAMYGVNVTITRVLLDRSRSNPLPLIALWMFLGHMIYSFYRK